MGKYNGEWINAVIANGGTVSSVVNLGAEYPLIEIDFPTMTSANISFQKANSLTGTFKSVGPSTNVSACGSGGYRDYHDVYAAQFVKIVSSGAQGAERTIPIRGIPRDKRG